MSDEIKGGGSGVSASEYQRAVRRATQRKATIADLERKLADATRERDNFKGQVGTLATERDEWKAKHDNLPNALKAENDTLRGQIRRAAHRDAIGKLGETEVADDKGSRRRVKLKGEVLDDLLTLTGYKPEEHEAEGGTPDAERIRGFFADAVKSRPWAIETADGSAAAPRPGPAVGRGIPHLARARAAWKRRTTPPSTP